MTGALVAGAAGFAVGRRGTHGNGSGAGLPASAQAGAAAPVPREAPVAALAGEEPSPRVRDAHLARLQQLVDHDHLTGLRNRHALERDIDGLLRREDGHGDGAVVALGIDNFRHLNASRGREMCDLVLRSLASVIASSAPEARAVARIGGDSFALLLEDADRARAESAARDVLAAVRCADLDVARGGIRATVSAGVALLDRKELTPGDVLLETDLAMARAKERGRNRVAVYTPAEHRPFRVEAGWAERIREALESSAFELHCQPVQSLRSAALQWELLLRLPERDGQLLPPGAFLPTAERFGLVESVDAWVFERAVARVTGWSSTTGPSPTRRHPRPCAHTSGSRCAGTRASTARCSGLLGSRTSATPTWRSTYSSRASCRSCS
jgi:diguanylate cyclase (GGDEF)-like protein